MMHERIFLIATVSALAALSAPLSSRATDCPKAVDQSLLLLGYEAFDTASWRNLITDGCVDAAVNTLDSYLRTNKARLTQEQIRELHFHAGQAFAFNGRDTESIPHFEQSRGGDDEWAAYVDATLAFLNHDSNELEAQRDRYANAPKSSQMRLAVINGFIKCFDKPYMEAVHCGM